MEAGLPANLGEEQFAEVWGRGRAMSVDQAVAAGLWPLASRAERSMLRAVGRNAGSARVSGLSTVRPTLEMPKGPLPPERCDEP